MELAPKNSSASVTALEVPRASHLNMYRGPDGIILRATSPRAAACTAADTVLFIDASLSKANAGTST